MSWLYSNQTDKISIKQDIETGHKVSDENPPAEQIKARIDNLQTSTTILGAGTSSIVYLADENKVEKRFKSSEDLRNEWAIYHYDIKICDFASSHNYKAPSNDLAIQPSRYRRAIDDFDELVFNPVDDIFAFGSIC
ncbi:hypothetical protein VE03_00873 [Pseudogymnoascus sp. 23342-1-I1]|nr:hypothetical protein VE03_00873 [Pseudogymnoascus sp. 23342-1-I1]